jgi:hypothetical protein
LFEEEKILYRSWPIFGIDGCAAPRREHLLCDDGGRSRSGFGGANARRASLWFREGEALLMSIRGFVDADKM